MSLKLIQSRRGLKCSLPQPQQQLFLVSCADKITQVDTLYINGPDWLKSSLWDAVFLWRVWGHPFAPEIPSAFAWMALNPSLYLKCWNMAVIPTLYIEIYYLKIGMNWPETWTNDLLNNRQEMHHEYRKCKKNPNIQKWDTFCNAFPSKPRSWAADQSSQRSNQHLPVPCPVSPLGGHTGDLCLMTTATHLAAKARQFSPLPLAETSPLWCLGLCCYLIMKTCHL